MALAGIKRLIGGSHRRLPKAAFDRAKPLRNPLVSCHSTERGLLLRAPLQSQGTGMLGLLAKWAKLPDTKEFELETVGAFVWELCDGGHTTETISRKLRERFKMNRLEADTALASFLEALARRRLVVLTIPRTATSKAGKRSR